MIPELIPDGDDISRWIFYSHMSNEERELIWDGVFLFPKGRPESVVWRKYLKTMQQVHEKGCECEMKKNHERIKSGKKLQRYDGAINARVVDIRNIRTSKEHGFRVEHDPSEQQGVYHAHIVYDESQECDFTKQDKIELISQLKARFSGLFPHACEH